MLKKDTLFENIVSLFTLKGLEYIIGFITFPYLVHTLGPTYYGVITFTQSFINYFILVTDYSFNLTAPQQLATTEPKYWGKIFTTIMYTKIIILGLCSFFIVLFITIFDNIFTNKILCFVIYLNVIGNVIFPIWFFQGIQKMRYITIVNIVSRTIATVLIFIFIKTSNDYILAALFLSITPIIAGCLSFFVLLTRYKFIFVKIRLSDIKEQIKYGWEIFLSIIFINIYSSSNVFFLGLLTNNTIVGYFSAVKKIIDCINGLLTPITQAIYPYINSKIKTSKKEALLFIKKCTLILSVGTGCISIGLYIFSDVLVNIFLGKSFISSIGLLKVMAFLPLITLLSNMWGIQTLIPFGYKNVFSKIVIKSAILNTLMIFFWIHFLEAEGVAYSMLITELFVTSMCYYKVKTKIK